MLLYIYLAVSLLTDVIITVCSKAVDSATDFWIPVLIFVGLFICCLIIHVLMLIVFSLLVKEKGKITEPTRWITLETANLLMKLLLVKVHTSGFEKLPEDQRFLLVSNHKSVFDPMLGLYLFKKYRLAFVAKKELMNIPVGRNLILGSGCLDLDRNDNKAAIKTILEAIRMVKSGDVSMGIYPEGGTNRTEELLLPFRNGAFKIAQKSGAPIVVITTCGTEKITKQMFRKRTHVYVDVLKVLPYEDIAKLNTNEVGEIVRGIMMENLTVRAGK